jgi:hypothetical protein
LARQGAGSPLARAAADDPVDRVVWASLWIAMVIAVFVANQLSEVL